MSAQQLATACTKLGLSISRSTLADLENGRRTTLTVAELLVIAAALDVAPLRLLVPLDDGNVEMLPGKTVNPWTAVREVTGADTPEMILLDQLTHLEQQFRDLVVSLPAVNQLGPLGPHKFHRDRIEQAYESVIAKRREFAARGLTEPELPNGDLAERLREVNYDTQQASATARAESHDDHGPDPLNLE